MTSWLIVDAARIDRYVILLLNFAYKFATDNSVHAQAPAVGAWCICPSKARPFQSHLREVKVTASSIDLFCFCIDSAKVSLPRPKVAKKSVTPLQRAKLGFEPIQTILCKYARMLISLSR